jgi:hypothetical protein
MILSLSRIAYVVRNQNMTEWMRVRTHRARPRIRIHVLLLKNASVRKCSIHCGLQRVCTRESRDQAAAHVPLPRITMSKSCPAARIIIMPEKRRRPQDRSPAGGVEGVYRGVTLACQTVNARMWQFFFSSENGRKTAVAAGPEPREPHCPRLYRLISISRTHAPTPTTKVRSQKEAGGQQVDARLVSPQRDEQTGQRRGRPQLPRKKSLHADTDAPPTLPGLSGESIARDASPCRSCSAGAAQPARARPKGRLTQRSPA